MKLRDYQQRTLDQLYSWFEKNKTGNPCLVLPTGSGKSHIIAALCKEAIQNWPETKVLMLTHVKELIAQNAEKLRLHWPDAPLGIYSAGLGMKHLGEAITFGGIQSLRTKSDLIGFADIAIIDECHLISTKDEGGYRTLLGELLEINPKLRVIGLTATPYRLGHGYITENGGLFDALIEPVKLKELIEGGYLAPLQSKQTGTELSVENVGKKGGEYIESELQRAVDTEDQNVGVVDEVIARAGERKAWLFFCAGVDHATHIRDVLIRRGIAAACVVGTTPKDEREQILEDFKAGKIRALTNANVLTTGFDYPDIDLIAMLRPTMSEGLYVQMAGRGMRIKSHTDHCLVMDFAGVVAQHGPITEIQPGVKKAGKGEQPVKGCPECHELVGISARECPVCGYQFPPPKIKKLELRDDDILCLAGYNEMRITDWQWRVHVSQASGKYMLKVSYYGGLSEQAITEYFAITHLGYAGDKAMRELASIAARCGADCKGLGQLSLDEIVEKLNACAAPNVINYKRDGKFHRIIARDWIKEVAYG